MKSGRGAREEEPWTSTAAARASSQDAAEVANERLRKTGVGCYARQTLSTRQ
jgi:hypothetical protein